MLFLVFILHYSRGMSSLFGGCLVECVKAVVVGVLGGGMMMRTRRFCFLTLVLGIHAYIWGRWRGGGGERRRGKGYGIPGTQCS